MSTTLIETLYAIGDALSGKFMRIIGGRDGSGNARALAMTTTGQAQMNVTSSDGATTAPVSTSTPAGSEAGLYSRVVSHPTVRSNDASGNSQPVGFGTGNTQLPVRIIGENLKKAFVDNLSSLKVAEPTRLIGDNFYGTTIDTRQWTTTVANNGTVTQTGGAITCATNTTLNGSAILNFSHGARFQNTASHVFYAGVFLGDTGVANNTRRWGVYDANNGYFFELSGTTIRVVSRKAGVDTAISSFNGSSAFTLDTNVHIYEIHYRMSSAEFYQDGGLIHSITGSSGALVANLVLPCRIESVNSGISTNQTINSTGLAVYRLGRETSAPDYFHSAAAATTVLKVGAGTLIRVVVNKAVNLAAATITLYDNTAGSGTIIAVIDATVGGTLHYSTDFYTGLTLVVTGANVPDVTIIYE